MIFVEWTLLAILLASALFIVIAVIFQKSADEGLSGTIAGGNETFYGKEKTKTTEKMLFKWTLIASLVFAVAVILAYVIQPDFNGGNAVDYWQNLSKYSDLFK
jgi:preprotein translocase subunit SecG